MNILGISAYYHDSAACLVKKEDGFAKMSIKRTDFGRQRTWISLTSKGVDAYTAHVKELKRIVG